MSEEQRKAIFHAVVETQDAGEAVVKARTTLAKQFAVSETQVKLIEKEGVDKDWPPL